jgi:hypothetical protein
MLPSGESDAAELIGRGRDAVASKAFRQRLAVLVRVQN